MTVRWTTRSGVVEAQTQSHDVSSGGIYFFLPKRIATDSQVEIVMTLPEEIPFDGQTRTGTRICCYGRVRRTEIIESDRVGVAAQFESYRFLRGNEDERSLLAVKG